MKPRTFKLWAVLCLSGIAGAAIPLAAQEKSHLRHNGSRQTAAVPAAPAVTQSGLTLEELEQIAFQNNPTLVQAQTRIGMSQGRALQAGLYPNPTVGYDGEQMGIRGAPGGERQGVFLQQEIVTAGKLRLSRAKYVEEAAQAQVMASAQQQRVLNGVRIGFYEVLAAQSMIEIHRTLTQNAEDAEKTTEQMVNVGQANDSDYLQAQVEARRTRVELRVAERRYRNLWQHLAALAGIPEMESVPLSGNLENGRSRLDHDSLLADLLACSPELQAAYREVARDQIGLQRERVEPIPNLNVRAATGYNFESRNQTTDLSIGIRIPLFDRNQGTIRQAEEELRRAQADVHRVELSLRQRFADAFNRYETAWESVEDFREESLPRARRAYELTEKNFKERRAAWPQVQVARRTYWQLQDEYIRDLLSLRKAEVELTGMLLIDGLTEPAGPTPQGHREATPKPR